MSKPINLRQARKARDRAEKRRAGDENAARHGLSKAERQLQDVEKAQVTKLLDHAKRERD